MIRQRKPIARKTPVKRKRSKPRRSERVRDPEYAVALHLEAHSLGHRETAPF